MIVAVGDRMTCTVGARRCGLFGGGGMQARRCGRHCSMPGDMNTLIADRIFDLAEPGLVEQLGERADQVGIGCQRRTAATEFHRGASPGSASIKLATASSASS